jgi:hypothetical protein
MSVGTNAPKGARKTSPAIVLILAFLTVTTGVAKADNPPALYHSLGDTFGCADPAATISLTDPNEARRRNAAWVKSVFNDGHCVSITPKSPWRFVSRAGDVALMDYAGTVGPPGSYYMRIDQLIDATGHHPADAGTLAEGQPAAPTTVDTASATALAPAAQAQIQQQSPASLATTASTSAQPTWTTGDIVLLLIALALAATGGYVVGRRR